MKIIISIAFVAMMTGAAYAAGYSGTGQTRGFTSGTGFVKERGNQPQDRMGERSKDSGDADDSKDKDSNDEVDGPPPSDEKAD